MRITLSLFCFALLLAGCDGGSNLQSEISRQEEALEKEGDPQTAESLLTNYQAYVDANPLDTEQNARYLYRAAGLAYRINRFPEAVSLLERAIRDFREAENTPNSILLLASIYEENLRNQEVAKTVYQAFVEAFPDHASVAEAKARISEDTPPLYERLQSLRQQMYDDATGRIQFRVANDFITGSQAYAMILPEDARSPELLHQAGETARSIRTFDQALALYQWLYEKYPGHERAPQALFLRAFILDNDLKRFDEAKVLYEDFLVKYPDDGFADDTEFLLQNLGKDDEEIINSFIQQQETQ